MQYERELGAVRAGVTCGTSGSQVRYVRDLGAVRASASTVNAYEPSKGCLTCRHRGACMAVHHDKTYSSAVSKKLTPLDRL